MKKIMGIPIKETKSVQFPKVTAVVLVMEDKSYFTANKQACEAISAMFAPPSNLWTTIPGTRPWKTIDEIMDKIKRWKNGE